MTKFIEQELIKLYEKNELVPFSLTIGWNTTTQKKELIMPIDWVNCNKDNYKKYINNKILKSKNDNIINTSNCLAVKMGTINIDGYYLILLDIDNKEDTINVFNGLTKWKELKNEQDKIKTFIQNTGNKGFHYLFYVSPDQYKNMKNIINLDINGVSYSIDVKCNSNSFGIVEPSNYMNDKGEIKTYVWKRKKNISVIPDWIYNLIKTRELKTLEIKPLELKPPEDLAELNMLTISELDDIKPLFNYLSLTRLNKYKSWFNLACLIKSLYGKQGVDILVKLSRKSVFYKTDEWLIKKYKTIHHLKFTIGTFYYYLKLDNPKVYQANLKNIKKEKVLVDIIKINSPYLLDLDDNLNKDTILNNNIDKFFNNDIKSFNLKSPYDTGKTQLLKKIITKYNPKRILWVSYRVSLTNDIKGNFKSYGFKSYLDGEYKANRFICQLESLLNLSDGFIDENIEVPKYDLVIIDEIESILSQFNSSTFRGKSKEIFIYLNEIINNSTKLITLDGDTANRTYSYISNFGKSINIVNIAQKNHKVFNVVDDNVLFKKNIYDSIENNKKIVIVSQSKTKATNYYNKLSSKYPKLIILIYTSDTGDEAKMKLDNVNNIWSKCNVLIYSPTIEAGVNFDIPHFDKIYGILADMSTSQRSFIQMLNRVRKLTDNEILLDNTDVLNHTLFKLNEIKEYYNFYDIQYHARNLKSFQKQITYKTVGDVRVKVESYDAYSINHLYNLVEDGNKKKFYFMSKFKEIIESKGNTMIFTSNPDKKVIRKYIDKIDDDDNDDDNFSSAFEKVIDAKLINNEIFYILMSLKKQNKASETDKINLTKRYYCTLLSRTDTDDDKLTISELKFWYYNKILITNYECIVDITKFKKTDEQNNKMAFEYLGLVKDILDKIGFENITDTEKYITGEQLIKSFSQVMKDNKIILCKQCFLKFFNVKPLKLEGELTTKKITGYLNSILNNYSIKIDSNQRVRINGIRQHVYKVGILNEVDEILKRKVNYKTLLADVFKTNSNEDDDEDEEEQEIEILDDDDDDEPKISPLDQM